MGQAFDEYGRILGEMEADSMREVLDGLQKMHPADAAEIHIKRLREQIPSIGRIVHYRLSAQDVEQIMRRRTTGKSIADRMKIQISQVECVTPLLAWPTGAQAHIGNEVHEDDVFPMLIVRVWGSDPTSAVSGQVFLDGNDVFWATSRSVGDQPGTFSWPTRV